MTGELRPCKNCGSCTMRTLGVNPRFKKITDKCIEMSFIRPGLKFCGRKENQQKVTELKKEIEEMEWRLKSKKFALKKMNRA